MKAYLKNHRQSPRKVRLVANLIKGKSVDEALDALKFSDKRVSPIFLDLLKSAAANAKNNFETEQNDLVVQDVNVDKGIVLQRRRARARGAAFPIKKRTSHISIKLRKVESKKEDKEQSKK